jgi:pseudouridine-5'-phosphate glycosidase
VSRSNDDRHPCRIGKFETAVAVEAIIRDGAVPAIAVIDRNPRRSRRATLEKLARGGDIQTVGPTSPMASPLAARALIVAATMIAELRDQNLATGGIGGVHAAPSRPSTSPPT